MSLTIKNVKKIKNNTENKLTKRVCDYILSEWECYDDKEEIIKDVVLYRHRPAFLIYDEDISKFFYKFREEINDCIVNTGCSTEEVFR